MSDISVARLRQIKKALQATVDHQTYFKLDYFRPYKKQLEFFDLGVSKRERMFFAGNQLGKTMAGAFELTCHLTGRYPDWWLGRRWDRPVRWWAAGESSSAVRDTQQKLLCGEPGVEGAFGTGMIPKELFCDKPSLARGVTDAYDTVQVSHATGGVSVLRFKSYEQGRTKFQAETLDGIWLDEEPDMDIYQECLARISASAGMVFLTFTPLKGRSDVVLRFITEPSKDREHLTMTIDDVVAEGHGHISAGERDTVVAGYKAYQREARARGVPMLGSGKVYPAPQEMIQEPAIENVPGYWHKLWGIDFGIGHPFAAVLLAWDKDNDVVHILHVLRMVGEGAEVLPLHHAVAMRAVAAQVPVAWPQDGHDRDKGSGEPLATLYKRNKLRMLPVHAQFEDGSRSTEAGIQEIQERSVTNRFRVGSHLSEFWDEYHWYHRKDGLIVKERDDVMDACRVAVMMKRYARQVPLGPGGDGHRRGQSYMSRTDEDDPWNRGGGSDH